MNEVYEFIKSCGVYYIATEQNGQPHVRPFGTILSYEGKLYIQSGHVKDFARQVAANPKVEICCFNGKGTWLRLSATLVEDERVECKKAMLDAYPDLRGMYNESDGNTAVWYLSKAKASLSSFTEPARSFEWD